MYWSIQEFIKYGGDDARLVQDKIVAQIFFYIQKSGSNTKFCILIIYCKILKNIIKRDDTIGFGDNKGTKLS